MTLSLPLVENFASDETAGPLRILTRHHTVALMPSRSGRGARQNCRTYIDRRSDAGSTDRRFRDGRLISALPILARCCIARSVALCVSRKASRQAVGVLDRYDQNVRQPVLVKIPKTVLRAVLLGFGTVFQPKARLDDHWSTSPKIVLAWIHRSTPAAEPGERSRR
jgi:hypothetical protein